MPDLGRANLDVALAILSRPIGVATDSDLFIPIKNKEITKIYFEIYGASFIVWPHA